jgi:thiol:disulfide interchange protein DsbD
MRAILFASMWVLASAIACSHAPKDPPTRSKAILLLEQSAAEPGTQTRIGIQFETDKDWHIYWKNPGDSGEPPRVHWQLPEGVTVGALQWPAPMRLNNTAGTDYGYEGSVVLLSALDIPATVQPGSNLPITGDLRWLVCHDTCIPQRAELKASMRIANTPTVDNRAHALLDAAAERIPKPLPDSFHLMATSTPDDLRLSIALNSKISSSTITHAVFFPAEPEQIDNAAPQKLENAGGVLRLELKKSDHLQRAPEHLNGVLVLNAQDSYQVEVPIRGSTAHKERKP